MASKTKAKQPSRSVRKCAEVSRIFLREEVKAQYRKINEILKKSEEQRSTDETELLQQSQDIVKDIEKRAKVRDLSKQRKLEVEDPEDVLKIKCQELANAIQDARNLVVYTGAGISTAASIPDYRGPNGVWTLLQQGIQPRAQDLSDSEPTYTHQCLTALHQSGLLKYVVSQNCDGLHVRSGLDRTALSELHGNMYIEVCLACSPMVEYVRLFDVTERTGLRRHKTSRYCSICNSELRDTIVHFGEKGDPGAPHNWNEAAQNVDAADVLLCLGSSLKVLKKYPCLWHNHKPAAKRAKLYIVNLQWTPKDDSAVLKINGRCDDVMKLVMEQLGLDVDPYSKLSDPLFYLYTPLLKAEEHTLHKKLLEVPPGYSHLDLEQRYGPRSNTFPSYVHKSDIRIKSKQWKATKLKGCGASVKQPEIPRNQDIQEFIDKGSEEGFVLCGGVSCNNSSVKPELTVSPMCDNDESGKQEAAMHQMNMSKKRKISRGGGRGNQRVTRSRLHDNTVNEDIDDPAKCAMKYAGKFQMDHYDVFDFEPSNSDDRSNSPKFEPKLQKDEYLTMSEIENNEQIQETSSACKEKSYLNDLISVNVFSGEIKDEDLDDSDQFLENVMDSSRSLEDSVMVGGLEMATDGTIALSKESEDREAETPVKDYDLCFSHSGVPMQNGSPLTTLCGNSLDDISHSGVPTQNGSPLMRGVSTTLCGNSLDDIPQDLRQLERSCSSKDFELMCSPQGSPTLPGSVVSPPGFSRADVNGLPPRPADLTTSQTDPDDPECGSFSLMHNDPDTSSPHAGPQEGSDAAPPRSPPQEGSDAAPPCSPLGVDYSDLGSCENLCMLSTASMQARAFPGPPPGKHSDSCIPETSTHSAAIPSNFSIDNSPSPSVPGLSMDTEHLEPVMKQQCPSNHPTGKVATITSSSISIQVQHMKKPHIPASPTVQTAAHLETTKGDMVIKSDITMATTTTSPVAMVTMTVSDYLSSVATRRSLAAATSTTNSHQHSPRSTETTSPDKSALLHVSTDSTHPDSCRQLFSPSASSPAHVAKTVAKYGMVGVPPGVLLSPGTMLAYPPPPGYPHHAMLAAVPMSYVQAATHHAPTHHAPAASSSAKTAAHMHLPVQVPSQPCVVTAGAGTSLVPSLIPSVPAAGGLVSGLSPATTASAPAAPQMLMMCNNTANQLELVPPKKKKSKKKKKEKQHLAAPQLQMETSVLSPQLLTVAEKQKSPTKKKSLVSPPTASKASSKNATSKAPFGPPDPQTYKYLSECLMRNIQLITGLPVASQASESPRTSPSTVTTAQSAMAQVMNTIARTVTASSQLDNPTPSAKIKSARPKKRPKPPEATQSITSAAAPATTVKSPGLQQPATVKSSMSVSQAGPTQNIRIPPPAHQGVGPPQQAIGEPSPAHQPSAQHALPPPPAPQLNLTDPAHMAAYQQMMTLQSMGMRHPMVGMPHAPPNAMVSISPDGSAQVHAALLTNPAYAQQLAVSGAALHHMTASTVTADTATSAPSAQSTISCPNIVAALGKPPTPQQFMWPVMMAPPGAGKQVTTSMGEEQRKTTDHTSNLVVPTQSQAPSSAGPPHNQEALKKSIHIQNILAHLRKATPGAPLPPYMFDSKTNPSNSPVPYSVSQEPVTLPHQWGQVITTATTTSTPATSLHHTHGSVQPATASKPVVCSMPMPAGTVGVNHDMTPAAQLQQSLGIMGAHYAIPPGAALAWHHAPVASTIADNIPRSLPLGGSAPAALLVSSIQESTITAKSGHDSVQSAASECSLSNSGSYESVARQVTPNDPVMLASQLGGQLSESGDTDICYKTYLIDTSAAGGDETMALQQARAAVLQQLAFTSTDPDDAGQTVVVMDTQDVAFIDDIECEIEIQDADSFSEASLTDGIRLGEVAELTPESSSAAPLGETSTGPPVYTEVVQQRMPEDGQIGQLGMQLCGEVDLGVAPATPIWDSQSQIAPSGLGQAVLDMGEIPQHLKSIPDTVMAAPGWFGKGLGVKKNKRKKSK